MSVHGCNEKGFRLAVVLLAAGAGSRFGGDKLMAPYRTGLLIDASLAAALAAPSDQVVVVTGSGADGLEAHLQGKTGAFRIVRCEDWRMGMSASLQAGVAAVEGADAVAVFLGDMPGVPPGLVAKLACAVREGAAAAAPVCEKRRGHPVVLGREVLAKVKDLSGDRGAGPLLERLGTRLTLIPTDDPGVLFDVDRKADLTSIR
jgi:molybdenum cofactor cytidylyltransferase